MNINTCGFVTPAEVFYEDAMLSSELGEFRANFEQFTGEKQEEE